MFGDSPGKYPVVYLTANGERWRMGRAGGAQGEDGEPSQFGSAIGDGKVICDPVDAQGRKYGESLIREHRAADDKVSRVLKMKERPELLRLLKTVAETEL